LEKNIKKSKLFPEFLSGMFAGMMDGINENNLSVGGYNLA
jgi:hypothetical protein